MIFGPHPFSPSCNSVGSFFSQKKINMFGRFRRRQTWCVKSTSSDFIHKELSSWTGVSWYVVVLLSFCFTQLTPQLLPHPEVIRGALGVKLFHDKGHSAHLREDTFSTLELLVVCHGHPRPFSLAGLSLKETFHVVIKNNPNLVRHVLAFSLRWRIV